MRNKNIRFFLVKVFVSVKENDQLIDFNRETIKVTVTDQTNQWNPVVRLKRLTHLDILKYEKRLESKSIKPIANTSEVSKVNYSEVESTYDADINNGLRIHMTRSKTQRTIDNRVENCMGNQKMINSKRKSEIEISQLTHSKKAKSSKDKGIPATTEVPQIIEEIPKITKKTIAIVDFKLKEVVWAKIRGSHHWPAEIISIKKRQYQVRWFNDYRTTNVFRTQLYKFKSNFHEFAKKFSTSIPLETAAKEALLVLANRSEKE